MFPQATFALLSPSNLEKTIFDHFHNVVHPGRLASHRVISSRFVWRGLSRDVTGRLGPRVSGLPAGQDPPPHTPGPPTHYIPQRRFSHLHVNLVGPLQYSNNFNYIFTIIDCTYKWIEAVPLSETSAAACAKALTFNWISRFGVPETITSDRGPQFTSHFGPSCVKCLTFHTNRQQLTTLCRTVRSKDCTDSSRMGFVHALPQQHGPRSSHLYSSDSEPSRGKTLVFPRLRQFSVPKLSCRMNFCKMMNF
jgi:hypothetical protein